MVPEISALEIADNVPRDCPGTREIGFNVPERYNASRVLFDNLANTSRFRDCRVNGYLELSE